MDFDLSEDQKMLADTAASFAKKDSPVERMRRLRDDPVGYDPKVWQQMGELGWLGIPFPEEYGGFGGQFIDVALVLEQFGRTLVPEPYLSSIVLGGMTILNAGHGDQHKRYLPALIEGETTLALAYAERAGRYDVRAIQTRARRDEGAKGFVLTGEKNFVLGGHRADHYVVSARLKAPGRDPDDGAAEIGLFVVAADAAGLRVQPIKTMDGKRAAIVGFEDVRVAEADRLSGGRLTPGDALELAMDLGAAAACAETLGAARQVLDMTVEYLGTREQFGVKIGTFQALQHRAVDMFIEVELCRSAMILAALEVDNPDVETRQAAVSAAKVQLATGGRYVVRQGIQLHGGIGCTDEHDVGLYFKRIQVLGALFGDEEHHVSRFAHLPGFAPEPAEPE